MRTASLKLATLLVSYATATLAQDLAVPPAWGSAASADPRAVREAYANGAAQALVVNIDNKGGLPDQSNGQALASMYSTLAMQDFLSGNKTWEKVVTSNLQTWIGQNDMYTNGTAGSKRTNSNGMQWALTLYYAYKAYGQQSFLELAQQAWDTTYADFITSDMVNDPQAALPPTRNSSWLNLKPEHCFNNGSIGGVFDLPDVSDSANILTQSVGPFAMLAGYLYEATQNETYKTTGLLNMACMNGGLMYNSQTSLIWGVVNPQQCNWDWPQSPAFQGWYILALSIWANITGDPDGSMTERLRQVVSATAVNTAWTEADGVLFDPNTGVRVSDNIWQDKAIFVRSLSEVLRRFPGSSDIATYIRAFVTIQYHGLINNARTGNNYTTSLTGPTPHAFNSSGNIVAMDVLNAAFDLLPPDNATVTPPLPSTSTSTSPSTYSATTRSAHPIGAILGGVIGGLALLGMMAGIALWYRRTQRRAESPRITFGKDENEGSDGTITPFLPYARRPYANDTPTSSSVTVQYVNTTESPKHRRMNAPPQPSPPVSDTLSGSSSTRSTQYPNTTPSDAAGHTASDILALVHGVVNNVLRDHGAVPPEYER
ncbi:hypothetical protein PENSPDRAFT_758132 [Peniophora sp. CONT]|nr:hypothetical protein PENSPDRAFT_758132 [Peniophora sp. CONT]